MMETLHILSHSPFSDGRFSSCLSLFGKQDGLLLTGDAVYGLTPESQPFQAINRLSIDAAVYALSEDIFARNIACASNRIKLIDYTEFVSLCCQYKRTHSWL